MFLKKIIYLPVSYKLYESRVEKPVVCPGRDKVLVKILFHRFVPLGTKHERIFFNIAYLTARR